jgi:hypothetical protein
MYPECPDRKMEEIRLEILEYSYWEHFKMAKDMAMILPIDHPRRKKVEKEMNELQKEIQKIKSKEV